AGFQSRSDEFVSVNFLSGDGKEQGSGLDAARVVGERGDLNRQVGGRFETIDSLNELAQSHCSLALYSSSRLSVFISQFCCENRLSTPLRQARERPPQDSARTPSRNHERSTQVQVPGTFGQRGAPAGLKNQGRSSRDRNPRLRLLAFAIQ